MVAFRESRCRAHGDVEEGRGRGGVDVEPTTHHPCPAFVRRLTSLPDLWVGREGRGFLAPSARVEHSRPHPTSDRRFSSRNHPWGRSTYASGGGREGRTPPTEGRRPTHPTFGRRRSQARRHDTRVPGPEEVPGSRPPRRPGLRPDPPPGTYGLSSPPPLPSPLLSVRPCPTCLKPVRSSGTWAQDRPSSPPSKQAPGVTGRRCRAPPSKQAPGVTGHRCRPTTFEVGPRGDGTPVSTPLPCQEPGAEGREGLDPDSPRSNVGTAEEDLVNTSNFCR